MRFGAGVSSAASVVTEAFSELLWPTRCVGCDEPGALLCGACRSELPWIEQRLACPVCGAPFGFLTCTECKGDWDVRTTVAALGFDGVPSRAVRCLKDGHELRLAPVMAAALACALEEAATWPDINGEPRFDAASTDGICFVPATAEAFARRGFDHMELVARELSGLTGLPVTDVLVRERARDQRILGKKDRAANLEGTIRATEDLSGANLLLIDDVATTGASLNEAARVLLARGACRPAAAVFARVW